MIADWEVRAGFLPTAGSGRTESVDEASRLLDEGVDHVPALLFGGRDEGADDGEIHGPLQAAEAAGDLLFDLHHAGIAFGLIVGEGNVGIVEETQDILLATGEAQEKIVPGSTRLATAFAAFRLGSGPGVGSVVLTELTKRGQRNLYGSIRHSAAIDRQNRIFKNGGDGRRLDFSVR